MNLHTGTVIVLPSIICASLLGFSIACCVWKSHTFTCLTIFNCFDLLCCSNDATRCKGADSGAEEWGSYNLMYLIIHVQHFTQRERIRRSNSWIFNSFFLVCHSTVHPSVVLQRGSPSGAPRSVFHWRQRGPQICAALPQRNKIKFLCNFIHPVS